MNCLSILRKRVNPFKTYTVAFTEGIVKGAQGIDPRTIAILSNPKNTNHKIWATLEDKIRRTKSISEICEEDHSIIMPEKDSDKLKD